MKDKADMACIMHKGDSYKTVFRQANKNRYSPVPQYADCSQVFIGRSNEANAKA